MGKAADDGDDSDIDAKIRLMHNTRIPSAGQDSVSAAAGEGGGHAAARAVVGSTAPD